MLKTGMLTGLSGLGTAVLAAAVVMALPARAQDLSTPEGARYCLCLEQLIAAKKDEVAVRQNAYEALRKQVAETTERLNRQRPTVNPNDPVAVETFRQALEARDMEADRLDREVLADFNQSATVYNERVSRYQGQCAGKMYTEAVLAQVKPTLVCTLD
jgi:hypothetical protein